MLTQRSHPTLLRRDRGAAVPPDQSLEAARRIKEQFCYVCSGASRQRFVGGAATNPTCLPACRFLLAVRDGQQRHAVLSSPCVPKQGAKCHTI